MKELYKYCGALIVDTFVRNGDYSSLAAIGIFGQPSRASLLQVGTNGIIHETTKL
jgi:hypothetical protein